MTALHRRRFLQIAVGLNLPLPAGVGADVPAIEQMLAHAERPRHAEELWILVDDQKATLSVYRGDMLVDRFFPVSLGRGGAKAERLRGSRVTPRGEFRVNRLDPDSRWHIFIGIDYPAPIHARLALSSGVFSEQDYDDYLRDYQQTGQPPQDTALGGAIGIHGIGRADPDIHARFHWTEGCVAVTNAQIERLSELVEVGTRVVIR
jgi:murein L,D-transpeptidase YafK